MLLTSVLPSFGQAFLAEWTAAANGGVGPTGMALATEGGVTYLYVSDHPRGRIIKFNVATGAVATTFGEQGTGNGQFNQPYGITIHPGTGDLFVAERGNHRVQRVTNTGAFVMAWGTAGTAQGQFNEPIGVALDAAGDVYVTEHTNHRVQKFRVTQSGGTWSATNLAMWGTQGSGNGQFNIPYGIAIDATGNVWVADGMNSRVQRFNTSGVFQSSFGTAGSAPGQFGVPTWVTFDAGGGLYVASTNSDPQNAAAPDAGNQWISRFNSSGTFVSRFGGAHGGGPGQFKLPFSVVVGANNRAYVADYYNSRVQVFDLAATPGTGAPVVSAFTIASSTATSVTFQIAFDKAVTGVDAADFTAITAGGAAATIGTVAGTGTTYTIPVTFTGTGTVQLNLNATGTGIADTSGNAIATGATGPVHTIGIGGGPDTTPPTVAGFTIASSTATSVTFQIAFSESVTGVNAADFAAATTGGAVATIGTVAGTGTTYTIPVTFTGPGTVQLNLNATGTGIADTSGNAIATGATGPVHTIGSVGADTTPPTIATFTTGAAAPGSITFNLTFSEAVTGVNATDFSVATTSGATATVGTVAGNGASYTIPVTFTGAGTLTLTLSATGAGIADASGNALALGGAAPAYTIPTTPGGETGGTRVISVTPPANGTYGKNATLTFVVTFSGRVHVRGSEGDDDEDDDDDDDDNRGRGDGDKGGKTDDKGDGGKNDKDQDKDKDGKDSRKKSDDDAAEHYADDDDAAKPFFTWTAAHSPGQRGTSGKVVYVSGSGTNALTFRYKVKNGDSALAGINLGTVIQLPNGAALTDTRGTRLTAAQLALPWAQNPLSGVIIDAEKSNNGGGNGNGNGNGSKSSQIIVLKPVGGLVVGEPITLTATTSSGLPVTFTLVSGNATLVGNVLTPKNRGALVLRVSQGGSVAFEPAAVEVTLETKEKRNDRLVNLSSRLRLASGDSSRSVIAGFVVTGGASKQILVRAVGPGLAAFGIRDALASPRLQLRDGRGVVIAENDGWNNSAEISAAGDRVGAFKLANGSRDSALFVALAPGAYTVQVGANGSGITLLEVYDAATGTTVPAEQLVNISTRGFVDTGDGQLVAGFVVAGDTPKRVLIRGIGPGLAAFGVPGTVADPVLKLFAAGAESPVAQNDNWEIPQSLSAATATEIVAASMATGAFPLAAGSKDAALVVTLPPGSYSAIVSGANNGTGAGLVEVYEIPNP